jgi:hypothetical protein
VRRLKGDRRILRLVLRGLRQRQRVDAAPIELAVDGRRVEVDGRRVATRARQLADRPHNEAYHMLRAFLVAEVTSALGRGAAPGSTPPVVQGEAARDIDAYLDRAWPSLTPQGFLVDLLSSRRKLLAAGAGSLSDAELDLLSLPADAQVSSWQWSVDDVPLLDAADALLNGVRATYEHIVVDEAQDLSPLQLESIRRRSRTGSMTVLGDLAQGTGQWAHESWTPVVAALRHERVTATTVELEYGYRLPAEVHEVAMRLLPEAAPGLACPDALRSSGHEVDVVAVPAGGDLASHAVAAVGELVADGIVGVIAPGSVRAALVAALDAEGIAWAAELAPSAPPVVVLTPDEAKGLEFDAVVAVEPAAMVDESPQGVRALFVAMTRCTNRLALVHALPLPPALGLGPEPGDVDAAQPAAATSEAAAAATAGEQDVAVAAPDEPAADPDAVDLAGTASDAPETVPADGPAAPVEASVLEAAAPTADEPDPSAHSAAPIAVAAAEPEPAHDTGAPEHTTPGWAAALDDLDRDVARAIAVTVAAKLAGLIARPLLPLVAEELARELRAAAEPAEAAPAPTEAEAAGPTAPASDPTPPEVRTF